MKLKTKIIAIALCATMVVGGVVGGSLAYFTDTDGEANVFTTGNVDIDLTEDFEQGSTLVPGVDINKDVQITNTGKGDAWVWYTYAIPSALDTAGDASENAVHVNHAGQNWDKYYTEGNTKGYEGTATSLKETWNVDYNPEGENGTPIGKVEIDDVEYNVYAVLYNGILKKGETTTVGMTKVYLDKHVDIDADGNWTKVVNGEVTELGWNDANGNPIIYVNAYGIQAEGFKTVEAAYKAYIGQWGELTELVKNVTPATLVETEKELQAALANGESVALTADIELENDSLTVAEGSDVTLNLNGKKLTVSNNQAKASSAITNDGTLTIKDGTITYNGVGDTSYGYGTNTINNNGKLTIDGATIINTTEGGSSNAIDNAPGSTLVVNSGTLDSNAVTVRLRDGSTATINDATITGKRAVQIHLFQNIDAATTLTINGGTFNGTEMALYSYAYGSSTFANTTVTINGGSFENTVAFGGGNKDAEETVKINGGTFTEIGRYTADGWVAMGDITVG